MSEVPLSESVTNPSPTPETEELKPQRKGVLISRTSGGADIKGALLKNEEIKANKERKTSNKKARAVGEPPKRRGGSSENVSSNVFAKKGIDPTLEQGQISVVSDPTAESGFKVTAPTAKELAGIRVTKRAPLRGEEVGKSENLLTISYPVEGATDGRGSRQILRIEVSDSGEISVAEEKPSATPEVASPNVTRVLGPEEVPPAIVTQMESTPSTTPATPEAASPNVTRPLGAEEVPEFVVQSNPEDLQAEKAKKEKRRGCLMGAVSALVSLGALATALLGGGRGEQVPGAAMSTPTPEKTATVINTLTGDTGAGADLAKELAGDRTEGRMRIHKTVQTETAPVVDLEKSIAANGETLTADADQLIDQVIPGFSELPQGVRLARELLVTNFLVTKNETNGTDYELTAGQNVNKISKEDTEKLLSLLSNDPTNDQDLLLARKAARYYAGGGSPTTNFRHGPDQTYFASVYEQKLNRFLGH